MALYRYDSDPDYPAVTVCGKSQKHGGGLWRYCFFFGDAPCVVNASSSLIRYGVIVLRVIRDKSSEVAVSGYGTCNVNFGGTEFRMI